MQVMYGYHHVDGDIPLKHMTLVPKYKDIVELRFIKDDWAPHYSELAQLTLEAAKDNDKVVLYLTLQIRMTNVTMSSRSSLKAEQVRIKFQSFNSQLILKVCT